MGDYSHNYTRHSARKGSSTINKKSYTQPTQEQLFCQDRYLPSYWIFSNSGNKITSIAAVARFIVKSAAEKWEQILAEFSFGLLHILNFKWEIQCKKRRLCRYIIFPIFHPHRCHSGNEPQGLGSSANKSNESQWFLSQSYFNRRQYRSGCRHGTSHLSQKLLQQPRLLGVCQNWYFFWSSLFLCCCCQSIRNCFLLDLPDTLPPANFNITTMDKFRYMANVCTFGYTYAFWNWSKWERHIDWMALNGINLPLSFVGQEAIWRVVWKKVKTVMEYLTESIAIFFSPSSLV